MLYIGNFFPLQANREGVIVGCKANVLTCIIKTNSPRKRVNVLRRGCVS